MDSTVDKGPERRFMGQVAPKSLEFGLTDTSHSIVL